LNELHNFIEIWLIVFGFVIYVVGNRNTMSRIVGVVALEYRTSSDVKAARRSSGIRSESSRELLSDDKNIFRLPIQSKNVFHRHIMYSVFQYASNFTFLWT